ncbi:MAG: hypothetical protein ACKO9Z_09440 [Planctomycetota bacterium]
MNLAPFLLAHNSYIFQVMVFPVSVSEKNNFFADFLKFQLRSPSLMHRFMKEKSVFMGEGHAAPSFPA